MRRKTLMLLALAALSLAGLGYGPTALGQVAEEIWQPGVEIINPSIGTSYVRGTTQNICWQDCEVAGLYHRIDLVGEGTRTRIAEGYMSSGYEWAIPRDIETSERYRIRVSVAEDGSDPDTAWVSDWSDYFAIIDDLEPDVVIPEEDPGGEGAISFTLTWKHNGSDEGPDIDLHVTDPRGNHWDFRSESSGHFDYDDQGAGGHGREDDGNGPERAYWDGETALPGEYEFFARWYDYGHSVTDADNAEITLNVFRRQPGGEQRLVASYTDVLRGRRDETPHWTYTVQQNEARLDEATLESLEIVGRDTVRSGRTQQLRAVATWSNGDETDVTQYASWETDNSYCEFERPGRLRNRNNSDEDQSATIYAEYSPGRAARAVRAEFEITLEGD
ncbi:MAG: hypothetical protein JW936_05630 [Sedimentisphaerales bacterium]|nr:hypothetical protein [Sedimentisphaerales bacterium]